MRRLLIVTVALVVLHSTQIAAPPPEQPTAELLRVAQSGRVEVLDPHRTTAISEVNVINLIYEGLTRPSATTPTTWEPCLAESWVVSADMKTWTFRLREGVKFHDGAELTAEAAKRSLDRCRSKDDPAAPPYLPYAEEFFATIDTIAATDKQTLTVKLHRADYRLSAYLGFSAAAIISPKAIAEMEAKRDPAARSKWLSEHPAGTGPFTLGSPEDLCEDVTLRAYAEYWAGKPTIASLHIQQVADGKQRVEMLAAGNVDFIENVMPSERATLADRTDITLNVRPGENISYVAMNCSAKAARPTLSLKLRKAIALAIRREAILELMQGAATAQYTLLPATLGGHAAGYKPAGDELGDDDAVKQAKALVDEVGAPEGPLRLIYPNVARPYLPEPKRTAELLRQQLQAIGLKVEMEPLPLSEMVTAAADESYDLLLLGWMGGGAGPEDFYQPLLSGEDAPSDVNFARFYDAEVAALIAGARTEPSAEKRKAIFEGLEKTVFDKHRPLVPLFSSSMAEAWGKGWTGIQIDSTGGWRFHEAGKK